MLLPDGGLKGARPDAPSALERSQGFGVESDPAAMPGWAGSPLRAMVVPKVVGDAGERVTLLLAGLWEGKEEGTDEDGFAAVVGAQGVRPNRAPV